MRGPLLFGAGEETRTPDPRITNALLYQLSYTSRTSAPNRVRELYPKGWNRRDGLPAFDMLCVN